MPLTLTNPPQNFHHLMCSLTTAMAECSMVQHLNLFITNEKHHMLHLDTIQSR
jgi:hypothetical protein